jgi:hypothetical protein
MGVIQKRRLVKLPIMLLNGVLEFAEGELEAEGHLPALLQRPGYNRYSMAAEMMAWFSRRYTARPEFLGDYARTDITAQHRFYIPHFIVQLSCRQLN